jgi:hypothetical protein
MRVLDYLEYRRTCARMRALAGEQFREDLIREAGTPHWSASTWMTFPADVDDATLMACLRIGMQPGASANVLLGEQGVTLHLLVRGEITERETAAAVAQ